MNVASIGQDDKKTEKGDAGKIVVTVQRVKLGEKWNDSNYRTKHKEGEDTDVDMDGAPTDVTHTAGWGSSTGAGGILG